MTIAILSDFSGTILRFGRGGAELDEELLSFYETLKPRCALAIFSAVDPYRDAAVRARLERIFDKVYREVDGLEKGSAESYRKIAADMGRKPEEVLFIDDEKYRVAAAREAGMHTVRHENTAETIEKIKEMVRENRKPQHTIAYP